MMIYCWMKMMIGNYYEVQVNSKLSMASIKTVVLNVCICWNVHMMISFGLLDQQMSV